MSWNVRVDEDMCIASGMCVGVAPGHFAFDDDTGLSKVVSDGVESGDDTVIAAAESCPVEAILVRDRDGALLAPKG
ncbi:ferredoxin [Nocardiopsis sediminis]|uniref:Ferredoxin n=1 Tax=Nocardiopsis sediminis TaxID=1778267 RepID=A0ABV8FRS5_9ACTN